MKKHIKSVCAIPFSQLAIGFFLVMFGTDTSAQVLTTSQGIEIEVTLNTVKPAIMLGEPGYLTFVIANHSPTDICVWEGGDYRNEVGRPNSFEVTVTRDGGIKVPQPEANGGDGFGDCQEIPAYGSHALTLFLPHWAKITAIGKYSVTVMKTLSVQLMSIWNKRSMEGASKVPAKVNTKFEVVPADERRMGDIIDSLGSAMLDQQDPEAANSARALAEIKDARVISYFTQALKLYSESSFTDLGSEYFLGHMAMYVLSQFDTDETLGTLELALNSPNSETREAIARYLGNMHHPRAHEILRELLDDPSTEVRSAARESLDRVAHLESQERKK